MERGLPYSLGARSSISRMMIDGVSHDTHALASFVSTNSFLRTSKFRDVNCHPDAAAPTMKAVVKA